MSEENKKIENENELPLEEEIKQADAQEEVTAINEGMTYEEAQKYTGILTSHMSEEQPPEKKEKKKKKISLSAFFLRLF